MPLRRRRERVLSRLLPFVATLALAVAAAAADEGLARQGVPGPVATGSAVVRAVRVHGDVMWRPGGDPVWRALRAGSELAPGDWVRTGEGSFAELVYLDEAARILVEANTLLQIGGGYRTLVQVAAVRGDLPGYEAALLQVGSIWAQVVSGLSRLWRFEVRTPTAVAGVRGTVFRLQVGLRGETRLYVREGVVELRTARTRRLVSAGEGAGDDGQRLDQFIEESRAGGPEGWGNQQDEEELVGTSDAQRLAWLKRVEEAFEDDLLEDDRLRAGLLEQALAAKDSQRSGLAAWLQELDARARSAEAGERAAPGEENAGGGNGGGHSESGEASSEPGGSGETRDDEGNAGSGLQT